MTQAVRIDEVKDWKDRATALASYARQQEDRSLETMALKIRARATRRCGELMGEFQPHGPKGGRPSTNGGREAPVSQRGAARAAGLSKDQERQARRLAAIPEQEFEEMVERDEPATLTELEQRGKRALERPKPEGFQEATYAMGAMRRFSDHCKANPPSRIASGLEDDELKEVLRTARAVQEWLGRFEQIIQRRLEK